MRAHFHYFFTHGGGGVLELSVFTKSPHSSFSRKLARAWAFELARMTARYNDDAHDMAWSQSHFYPGKGQSVKVKLRRFYTYPYKVIPYPLPVPRPSRVKGKDKCKNKGMGRLTLWSYPEMMHSFHPRTYFPDDLDPSSSIRPNTFCPFSVRPRRLSFSRTCHPSQLLD